MRKYLAGALLAGCGRLEFDPSHQPDGRPGDDLQLVAIGGSSRALDAIPRPDGTVALTGYFDGTIAIEGTLATSTATEVDVLTAVVDPVAHTGTIWTGGSSVRAEGQGIGLLGTDLVVGGYFAGTLANVGGLSAGGGQDLLMIVSPAMPASTLAIGNTSRNVQLRGFDVRDGRIAATGVYAGSLQFDADPLPAPAIDSGWLAVLDDNLLALHSLAWTGNDEVRGNDIALGTDGSACVTGRFRGTVDFGTGPVTAASSDGFVARYDAAGVLQWVRTLTAIGEAVAVAPDGDCIALLAYDRALTIDGEAIPIAGASDALAIRLAATDGARRWTTTFAGAGPDALLGVAVTTDDRVVIGGWYTGTATIAGVSSTADGDSDGVLLVLASDGSERSRVTLGGAGRFAPEQIGGLQIADDGSRAAFAFSFEGELRVGAHTATSAVTSGGVVVLPL